MPNDFDEVFAEEGAAPVPQNPAIVLREQRLAEEAAATGEFVTAFDAEPQPEKDEK